MLPCGKSDHDPFSCIQTKAQKRKYQWHTMEMADEADSMLNDFCFTDWDMFRDSSHSIKEFTSSVMGLIVSAYIKSPE
jgi:hypothetical protein